MKKICYVTTIGGSIKAFFIPQLQYLQEQGYDVSVICSPDRPELKEELGEQIRFIPVNIPRGISVIKMIKAMWKLKKIFATERYDLIQYSTPNASFCAALAGKQVNIKRRNYHLMGLRYLGTSGLLRWILKGLEKVTCNCSTSIECVSKSNLDMAIEEGLFSREKGTIVWNGTSGGVDLKRFDITKRERYRKEIRSKLGICDEEFVFGFAGRITRDKGVDELFRAFIDIDKGMLLMIGNVEKPLDMQLFNSVNKNRRVYFTGSVNDIEKYYCAMDVLILPSYREGFGMVVAEAAAMGTPAIVSNIPGPLDAIEKGKTALTIEPKNVSSLEKAMKACLNGEFKAEPEECNRFIRETFDSGELCKRIFERKEELLSV